MIKNSKPLSMAEASGYLKKDETSETDVKGFVKKFLSLSPKEAKEMKEKLIALDLLKMDDKKIVKIIDLLPKNKDELNKIFIDVGLDEDENKKILEIVKEYL